MKIFSLERRTDKIGHDEAYLMLIVAENTHDARVKASQHAQDEGAELWLSHQHVVVKQQGRIKLGYGLVANAERPSYLLARETLNG